MKIVNCAECNKEIDLEKDPQTSCAECKKDFCFLMHGTCFDNFHQKHKLQGHTHLSILDPKYKINLVSKEKHE